MSRTYWGNAGVQLKRAHKFYVTIGEALADGGIQQWLVQDCTKPSFELSKTEVHFLDHIFKYPGKLSWKPISLTIVDVVNANIDSSEKFIEILKQSGYVYPDEVAPVGVGPNSSTISKRKSVGVALGNIKIEQIDDNGQVTDRWTVHNSWIQSLDFGKLDYKSEEPLNIQLVIEYDWAEFEKVGNIPATPVIG